WTRSGAFDADPSAPGVQPEPDPATYNGMIWALAAEIHGLEGTVPPTDPRYQAALAYYGARAYGPELLWDWSAAPGAQQELARLIERSDDRFRQATTALGVVIANHLLAAGDAWLSSRGRAAPAHLRVVPAHARLPGPLLVVSIPFGGS
ncbi:MAG TPA: hypothetical protein VFQ22_01425, partial [Longimicrobiales bacterium]|nr:hypothetical protein [Longimicrobiales bacterium]